VRLSFGWLTEGWRDIPRAQRWMVAALAALLLLAQIDQPYPETAPLHHLPTLALILFLPGTLRRWPMSTGAVACILIFFALHTVAARWTYTDVPYDQWARALTGRSVSDVFGFTRNHFDRLVHLSYGLLAVLPVFEALRRHLGLSRRVSLYIAVEAVLAVSALYEVFEWGLSLAVAGDLAARYNGQQGDIWDAQKDMALAFLGSLVAAFWVVRRRGGEARLRK
jgi:putative membrane protein